MSEESGSNHPRSNACVIHNARNLKRVQSGHAGLIESTVDPTMY